MSLRLIPRRIRLGFVVYAAIWIVFGIIEGANPSRQAVLLTLVPSLIVLALIVWPYKRA